MATDIFGTPYTQPFTPGVEPEPELVTPNIVPEAGLMTLADVPRLFPHLGLQEPGAAGKPGAEAPAVGFEELSGLGPAGGGRDDAPHLWAGAMRRIESGGDYTRVTDAGRGRQVYGAYQVLDSNIGPWTERWFGQRLTPAQFLANPAAQDAVFQGQFGEYVRQFGSPGRAARAWLAGPGGVDSTTARDRFGTTPAMHEARFLAALGQPETRMGLGAGRETPPTMVPPDPRTPPNQPNALGEWLNSVLGPPPAVTGVGGIMDYANIDRGSLPPRAYDAATQRAIAAIVMRGQQLRQMNPGASPEQLTRLLLRDPVFGQNALFAGQNVQTVLQAAISDLTAPQPLPHLPHDATVLVRDPTTGAIRPALGPDGQPIIGPSTRVDPVRGAAATRRVHILETIGGEGATATRALADLTRMRTAFQNIDRQGSAGWVNGLRSLAAGIGIENVANASDLTLVQAIAARLAPATRTPGAGAMSDFETRSLLSSLPNAWQSARGREYVLSQLERLARYNAERGHIANRFFSGDPDGPNISRAFAELIALDNRFANEMGTARQGTLGTWTTLTPDTRIRELRR